MRRPKASVTLVLAVLIAGPRAGAADETGTTSHGISDERPGAAPTGRASIRFPDDIPLRRDATVQSSTGGQLARAVAVLTVLLVAGVALVRVQRRSPASAASGASGRLAWLRRVRWRGSSGGALRVVQSTQLTGRVSLHVVRWDGQEWVIACADQGISVIGSRRVEPEPSAAAMTEVPRQEDGSRHTGAEEKDG